MNSRTVIITVKKKSIIEETYLKSLNKLSQILSRTRLEMPKVDGYAMNRSLYKDEV